MSTAARQYEVRAAGRYVGVIPAAATREATLVVAKRAARAKFGSDMRTCIRLLPPPRTAAQVERAIREALAALAGNPVNRPYWERQLAGLEAERAAL